MAYGKPKEERDVKVSYREVNIAAQVTFKSLNRTNREKGGVDDSTNQEDSQLLRDKKDELQTVGKSG